MGGEPGRLSAVIERASLWPVGTPACCVPDRHVLRLWPTVSARGGPSCRSSAKWSAVRARLLNARHRGW